MNFPTLYKLTSTGATQQWTIATEANTITTVYGQVGGKLQTATDIVREGKNIGRSNETTPTQQAEAEARSQWEAKVKKGYVENVADARDGKVNTAVIAGGVEPMLAHTWEKRGKNIVFPAAVQPKLDGHRCIAIVEDDGSVTLWSRTRKPITGVPHVAAEIQRLALRPGTILDGELYNHAYRDNFEELTSFIRQTTPKPGSRAVQYHVYDIVAGGRFELRSDFLGSLLDGADMSIIVRVNTQRVADEDEMMNVFGEYIEQGYEGLMLRNLNSPYVNKRSADLIKVKQMDDAEYEIVGVEEGRGKLAGRGIFVCKTPGGDTFRCKLIGNIDNLVVFLQRPDDYIGRMLTVKFQEITAAGMPRFPVGMRLREDV